MPIGPWMASGAMMVDFFGGVPNFQNGTVMGLPRPLTRSGAWIDGSHGHPRRAGSCAAGAAGPDLAGSALFSALLPLGNLHLRAPQARAERRVGAALTLAGGIVAPIAGDFSDFYEFAPAAGAGERSKRPALQARTEFQRGISTAGVASASREAAGTAGGGPVNRSTVRRRSRSMRTCARDASALAASTSVRRTERRSAPRCSHRQGPRQAGGSRGALR